MDLSELSPEQLAKVRECKTPADMLALAKAIGYKLSDEQVDGIAGGTFWNCDQFLEDYPKKMAMG